MFYENLKFMLFFFKIIGFLPLKNILNDERVVKYKIISIETVISLLFKIVMVLIYLLTIPKQSTRIHITLAISPVVYECLQILFLNKLLNFIYLITQFEYKIKRISLV